MRGIDLLDSQVTDSHNDLGEVLRWTKVKRTDFPRLDEVINKQDRARIAYGVHSKTYSGVNAKGNG